MNRLSIGQRGKRKGWKTLDAHNGHPVPDYCCSIPPFPKEVTAVAWDEIEMIHVLEHFYYWDAVRVLKECHSILADGGRIAIECPNIEYAARVLIGMKTPPRGAKGQFDMWPLYGDPGHKDPLFVHRWGYTPTTLRKELEQAGFAMNNIQLKTALSHFPVRDFRMEAIK